MPNHVREWPSENIKPTSLIHDDYGVRWRYM